MPNIRPISDLRNHFNEISKACHEGNEPVFITKNGEGDMVVMSLMAYERQEALLSLYKKLVDVMFNNGIEQELRLEKMSKLWKTIQETELLSE